MQEIPSNWGRVVGLGSLNQSTTYFYAGPSWDSEIFKEPVGNTSSESIGNNVVGKPSEEYTDRFSTTFSSETRR